MVAVRSGRRSWIPKPILAVLLAATLFVSAEAVIQWRSYQRTGLSIFTRVHGASPYVFDAELGFNLLRANHVSGGERQEVASNSWGLRSPEIPETKPPGVIRIAILGASTVMGAYAATNDETFPARLQETLRTRLPDRNIDVINAGVVGLSLQQQKVLFERRISRLRPDFSIVYSGFNDLSSYCRKGGHARTWIPKPLVEAEMPRWLLSIELLLKNTVPVRTLPEGLKPGLKLESIDLEPYRQRVADLLATLQASGTRPMIARNARSFRPQQPLPEQLRLSAGARFSKPCFDLEGLHLLYERHNGVISEVAESMGVPVLPIDQLMPGGDAHFADASHFSPLGERVVAVWLADRLEPLLAGITEDQR